MEELLRGAETQPLFAGQEDDEEVLAELVECSSGRRLQLVEGENWVCGSDPRRSTDANGTPIVVVDHECVRQ